MGWPNKDMFLWNRGMAMLLASTFSPSNSATSHFFDAPTHHEGGGANGAPLLGWGLRLTASKSAAYGMLATTRTRALPVRPPAVAVTTPAQGADRSRTESLSPMLRT